MLLSRVTYSKGHSPEVNRWVPYHRKTTSLLHGWESNQQPSDYLPDSLTATPPDWPQKLPCYAVLPNTSKAPKTTGQFISIHTFANTITHTQSKAYGIPLPDIYKQPV